MLEQFLLQLGHEVVVKSFDFDTLNIELLDQYAAIVVGTYTWDDGDLPYEIEDFYIDLEMAPIKNIPFAVYGSADSCYDTFGGAIDLIADRAIKYGADVYEHRLKIDLLPTKEDEKRCEQFAMAISEKIKQQEQTTTST